MGFSSRGSLGRQFPCYSETVCSRSRLRAALDSMMRAGSSTAPTELTKRLVPVHDREPKRLSNVDKAPEVTRLETSWDYRSPMKRFVARL